MTRKPTVLTVGQVTPIPDATTPTDLKINAIIDLLSKTYGLNG